jgi:hypothetical protein
MRVSKSLIPVLAREIINGLCAKDLVELKVSREDAMRHSEDLIIEELSIEDNLNREVRDLLRKYDSEIEKGRLDYRKLFDLTKQKLVKERNIIL